MRAYKLCFTFLMTSLIVGCGSGGGGTYSLLDSGQQFQQNSASQITNIDVLWVVDNSGSMASSQQNLADNFPAFIQRFIDKGFNFQVAVTTTDSYLALPAYTPYYNQAIKPSYYGGRPQEEIAWFKDGTWTNPSGFRIITPTTPNLIPTFVKNALQGTTGRGDERSFQSLKTTLSSAGNAGFVRPGGFLAVILLTDEDDFSHDGTASTESYTYPGLHSIASYVSYLDGLTNSSGDSRRYSVNTISVNDQTCLTSIFNGAQKIGTRVGQLADATGGIKGDLCGDFAQELDKISKAIVELSTQFYLNAKPVESSIRVYVNGQNVPNASTTGGAGGWTYNSTANSIVFSGSYVPEQSANINVTFDPETVTF